MSGDAACSYMATYIAGQYDVAGGGPEDLGGDAVCLWMAAAFKKGCPKFLNWVLSEIEKTPEYSELKTDVQTDVCGKYLQIPKPNAILNKMCTCVCNPVPGSTLCWYPGCDSSNVLCVS